MKTWYRRAMVGRASRRPRAKKGKSLLARAFEECSKRAGFAAKSLMEWMKEYDHFQHSFRGLSLKAIFDRAYEPPVEIVVTDMLKPGTAYKMMNRFYLSPDVMKQVKEQLPADFELPEEVRQRMFDRVVNLYSIPVFNEISVCSLDADKGSILQELRDIYDGGPGHKHYKAKVSDNYGEAGKGEGNSDHPRDRSGDREGGPEVAPE